MALVLLDDTTTTMYQALYYAYEATPICAIMTMQAKPRHQRQRNNAFDTALFLRCGERWEQYPTSLQS